MVHSAWSGASDADAVCLLIDARKGVSEEVDAILAAGRAAPGHVVNLGHGVPPATDADVLTRIVARVHGSADWESVALAGWEA